MMHRVDDRRAYIRMEFKRFLDTVIAVPAMILARARNIVARLVSYTTGVDRLFSVWTTVERIHFAAGTARAG
jgi:hypothetical protein